MVRILEVAPGTGDRNPERQPRGEDATDRENQSFQI